ncbi:hypothetical protein JYU34_005384 [Plutella xylostella]|uniref:Uncharacterized protein n=1 Tax=Plutella xylostella TaxID=51655 RepID=A0ABQ7QWN6_PLUXY|nr:hypothetical protein JYU34_005384 [Plutella xylostella]
MAVSKERLKQASIIKRLHKAAGSGKLDILRTILSASPGLVNATDAEGQTLLHYAADGNQLAAVSFLLSQGAAVNEMSHLKWTPLHSACNLNHYEVVGRLLAAGADVGAIADEAQTVLHLAASTQESKDTLLLLLTKEDITKLATVRNTARQTAEDIARDRTIFGGLFEMAVPAVSYIRSVGFTCNGYCRGSVGC